MVGNLDGFMGFEIVHRTLVEEVISQYPETELFEHLPSSAYLSYRWLIYQLLSIVSSSPRFFFIYLSPFVASTGYEALFFPFAYEDLTKTSCKNHPVELLLRLRRERDR
ncbi:hypothetical protein PCH_Pc20g10620 [Penicillium rubens Wisconsin 54-1255]|uniref:Uncharacterized protein n=1 Tax=Penicillium rubens (strain ATCC 28089 / DSM 1075 / NRRL 1951 / Wisconsin 54-1255) TaxID=500485 RepID=B6HFV5_PENRW|nr:hypothetical protein PCH_Pc20g10620 [Penicillium rubens Wisconsin 54-1255]